MKSVFTFVWVLLSFASFSQDVSVTLKEASNFERSLKEEQALEKYNQVLSTDANNMTALLKCSELSISIGIRQEDKRAKKASYESAKTFADKAYAINPNSADVNYIMSATSARLAEVETDNKKTVALIKDVKMYADKALAVDPNHAKANYALGKWHFDMVQMSWIKKAAAKAIYGGMPESTIDDAISHMEKSRSIDQYFVADYLELAKAYKYDNKPAKAIEVLQKLVKLPARTANDVIMKVEGKKMLDEMM